MTNTLKHLSLLTRMENSGMKPRLTGKFPEDALDQTCERVETFQLQDRLRAGDDNVQIQKELVRTPEFAMLYRALCDHAANDEAITNASVGCGLRGAVDAVSQRVGAGSGGHGSSSVPAALLHEILSAVYQI